MNDEQNIILKDNRLVILRCFENIVVKLAHIGHQGLVRKKSLLRSKVFNLNMDKIVAEKLAFCILCQSVYKKPKSLPVKSTEIPKKVWQTVHMDYLRSFSNRKVKIDELSMYPVIVFTDSTSSKHPKG